MDLFEAARTGREAAFLQLFDEHHLPLYRFAYRLTGSQPDAEDVVQECFLELLRPGCSYDPGRTAIRTYLFGVVRNQSLKRRDRKAGAQSDLESLNAPPSLETTAAMEICRGWSIMEAWRPTPHVSKGPGGFWYRRRSGDG
jgi:RNA polymerase sigma-70 factor (ECF subfamily)